MEREKWNRSYFSYGIRMRVRIVEEKVSSADKKRGKKNISRRQVKLNVEVHESFFRSRL